MSADTRSAAIVECNLLAVRFWNYMDAKTFPELAQLFAPGGVWVRPEGLALTAATGILDYLAKRSKTIATCHVVSNIDVWLTGADQARSISVITAYKHDDGKALRVPAPLHGTHRILRASDHYSRTEAGWRIVRKEVTHVFDADLH